LNLTRISDAAGSALGGAFVQGAKLAAVAVAGLALALDKFGDKAIEAFGERQGALRAYTTLLGDAHKAEEEFLKAQALSQKTDLTSSQLEGAQKSLMVAGFRGKDLDAALLATADVASMAAPAERQLTTDRFARALSQVFSKGKLQGEEIRQLTEAGLSRSKLNEELIAAGLGGDAASVERAVSGGKVTSGVGIAAIERAILAQFGTSRLGEYATGSSGTISSLLSNRDEGIKNLMKGYDLEKLPQAAAYKDALKKQADSLSLNSETGNKLSLVLQSLTDSSLGFKGAWEEGKTAFLEEFVKGFDLKDTGEIWKQMRNNVRETGSCWGGRGQARQRPHVGR
jgi:tape measure domain